MDVVFVCLWLDHYLHQHGGCGPMGATWLGGVATFTTARDWCIETVYCSCVVMAGCFIWYFSLRSMLLVIYAFIGMCFSCLDDFSFNTFSITMISLW